MATEGPSAASLDLVNHTIEDLQHRITLLQKDLPLHQAGLGSEEHDQFWAAMRQFQEAGEHTDPKKYVHGKGFKLFVSRLQDIQTTMFAKRDAVSAPIDPEQTIAYEAKRDPLVDILIDKRVFLPHKDVHGQDRYSEEDIMRAFAKVTEADLIRIAQESGLKVAVGAPREAIIHRLTRELNSNRLFRIDWS